ncbi:MAG: GNAT family N-acetyltransferase [Solirubrobacterales bacterium]|nr:GNAT family N-acetyltransferase [Solirubrobacterales bacterium]
MSEGQRVGVGVRPARPEDAEALAEAAIAAWREGFRGIVPDDVDPRRAWQPRRLAQRLAGTADDGTEILAAEVDGAVRGLLLLGPSRDVRAPAAESEVVALYVHPEHWRRGLGRALVAGALERLAVAGYRETIVWTLAESPRNLAFYEALGFRRDGGTQRRPSFGSPLEVRLRIGLDHRRSAGGR